MSVDVNNSIHCQTAFLPYGVKIAVSDKEEQGHAILCEGMEQHA